MKRFTLGTILIVSAGIGFLLSPAYGAGSHPGPYKKIFGNSTACAYGRASVNDTTHKAGARTSNFAGCSTSNAHKNAKIGYLGAQAFVINNVNGAICGSSALKWNSTSTWTQDASTPRKIYGSGCDHPGFYYGAAKNYRGSDSGMIYRITDRVSNGAWYFSSYLI